MLSVSSLRNGLVTAALKEGLGSAILNPSGNYTGAVDKEYIVEIDGLGTGEVGSSTFKWSDGSGGWNATGVTTSASNLLLNNGIYINFTSGTGADFVLGDKWYLKGINLFNAGKMIDLDRDHRYRSAAIGAPNTITITLDAEQAVDALSIFDHNLTATATIYLWGDDSALFNSDGGMAQVIELIPWASERILHFLTTADRTKKFWQLRITDAANTDGYIEIGEFSIGTYLELSRNYKIGYSEETEFLKDTNTIPYGVNRHRFYNARRTFNFDFDYIPIGDVTSLRALITAICSRSLGTFKPFYFCPDSDVPSDFHLVELASLPIRHYYGTKYDIPLTLTEVVTSV